MFRGARPLYVGDARESVGSGGFRHGGARRVRPLRRRLRQRVRAGFKRQRHIQTAAPTLKKVRDPGLKPLKINLLGAVIDGAAGLSRKRRVNLRR